MTHISIATERPRVEALFAPFVEVIGSDLPGYRNHVYRAITYAMHFLNNAQNFEQLVETAFVYHDIGLWTHRKMAYLQPSEELALSDNETKGWGLDPMALRGAIHWHHKVFRYRGDHEEVIEACRKADWIDASMGRLRKGLAKKCIVEVQSTFPNLGFHKSLLRLAKDNGGSTVVGGFQAIQAILKW